MNTVRVRLAPSPTGYLHIGTLRTYLYDYLFAKKHHGTIVIRVEDTDQKREVEGAVDALMKTLKWSGLAYDEGLDKGGDFGPYTQSERKDLYNKYVQELIEKGSAYYAFDTAEELEAMRAKQTAEKRAPMYDRDSMRNQFTLGEEKTKELLQQNAPHVVRMFVPENKEVTFNDLVRGKVTFNTNTVDDQILMKSDGFPTYHLAVIVDDHLMKISHVFRGEEWLSSTPKHILLYEAFGWEKPEYAHLPLLLNPDKTKLSKRKGDVSVESYIQKGYLRDAILNFVVLLGWNPKTEQEILSLPEMIEKFDLANVHKAGAVVNMDRLNWFNAHYIKQMPQKEYLEYAKPFLGDVASTHESLIDRALLIQQERLKCFSELPELTKLFFEYDATYDANEVIWKKSNKEEALQALEAGKTFIAGQNNADLDPKKLEEDLKKEAEKLNLKPGNFFWPLRYALSGKKMSPGVFEMIWAMGVEESVERLTKAKEKLQNA